MPVISNTLPHEQAPVSCCKSRGLAPARHDAEAMVGMVWLPGGRFTMGSDRFYREERPAREATVDGFWIDLAPVTNDAFAAFVAATGYVTLAERQPSTEDYPDADPALLVPGSSVFVPPAGPVDLRNSMAWWAYVPGADWRHPEGPASSIEGLGDHPVVHVAHEDALAFARWAGKQLPSETQWEYAARGGLPDAVYPWGDELNPGGRVMANTWQGRFPWENLATDGYERTSPVGAYPPNGYGLFDMAGNVWEWTGTPYDTSGTPKSSCCGPASSGRYKTRMVVKGGSHLCAPNYCLRYRPSARQGEDADTSTSHIGFRCVRPTPGPDGV